MRFSPYVYTERDLSTARGGILVLPHGVGSDIVVMICFVPVYNVMLFVCINVDVVLKRGPQGRSDIVQLSLLYQ